MKASALLILIESAFRDWPAGDAIELQLPRSHRDSEVQEMLDYVSSLNHWQECKSEWINQLTVPIVPPDLYVWLLPALLRFCVSYEDAGPEQLEAVVYSIAQLPPMGGDIVLRIELSSYNNEQLSAVGDALEFIRQSLRSSRRIDGHLKGLVALFRARSDF